MTTGLEDSAADWLWRHRKCHRHHRYIATAGSLSAAADERTSYSTTTVCLSVLSRHDPTNASRTHQTAAVRPTVRSVRSSDATQTELKQIRLINETQRITTPTVFFFLANSCQYVALL